MSRRLIPLTAFVMTFCAISAHAQSRKAPPGTFKELDDVIAGDALILHGKQLFIDNHVIARLDGVRKVLNQPVKHPRNPLLRKSRHEQAIDFGTVVHDPKDGLHKMWYQIWGDQENVGTVGYAVSKDGIKWKKPVVDKSTGSNLVIFDPKQPWVGAPGILIDRRDPDPSRRFKMTYSARPGPTSTRSSCVAYSADGTHWKAEARNPLIPFSDTQICPYWDARLARYVAYLRFGPPNIRKIARIESTDFLHWSPKLTVIPGKSRLGGTSSNLDKPFATNHYTMTAMPYAGIYVGLLNTYHGETKTPIPDDKLWMDRVDAQLVFSRNGVTWQRVLKDGAITAQQLRENRDWKQAAAGATFLPYGKFKKDWDWGQIYPHHPPLIVGDEIRFYYAGISARHWAALHKDKPDHAIGLATLRLDGFVSVETDRKGTMTTKPIVFLGDTLVINANAKGGSLVVEALDVTGKPIKGFSASDCAPITTDSVRHVVTWKGHKDCHLLQGRPIRLRFHLKRAKLYAFEPGIRHSHYLQSYD